MSKTLRVLYVGQQPETVDFSDPALPPGTTPEKIHAGIAKSMQQMKDRGWDAQLCLVQPATASATLTATLDGAAFDCVVIGAGLRMPPKSLLLFETLVNAIHRAAPASAIAFNTHPEDTADAAARWMKT